MSARHLASARLYRVDSEPPPPGEPSGYDAPTRVGPMSRGHILGLLEQADAMERRRASGVRPAVHRCDGDAEAPSE